MKHIRKWTALWAVLSLLLTLWAPMTVGAEAPALSPAVPQAVAAPAAQIQWDDLLYVSGELLETLNNGATLRHVYNRIIDGILADEEYIEIPFDTFSLTEEETQLLVSVVDATLPESYGDNIGHSYSSFYFYSDGSGATFYPWTYTWELNETQKELTNRQVEAFTADLEGKSDFDKSRILYQRLVEWNSYDMGVYHQTAYGALIEKMSVCAGYARAYQLLLQAVGIPCLYVTGMADNGWEIGGHAWNIVKLDGKWYYADPTWDDSDNPEFPLAYRYFNITYDEISTDHFLDAVYEPWVPKEPAIDANYYYHEGTLCNTPTVELLAALFRQQSPVILYVTEDREAVRNFFFSHFYEIAEAIGATHVQSVSASTAGSCGLILYLNLGHEHNYLPQVVAPTCTTQGYTRYACTLCQDAYVEAVTDPLGHDMTAHPGKTPTCVEAGWDAYETCSRCGLSTQEIVWDTCHYEPVEVVEPTCYLDGYTLYRCNGCGRESYRDYVDALGHDLVLQPGKEPTCIETGWYPYEACSRCGYNNKIERWDGQCRVEAIEVVEPDCHNQGYTWYACIYCGIGYYSDYVARRHEYGDQWQHNELYHWQDCTLCDAQTAIEPHTDGTSCDVCGYGEEPPILMGDINADGKLNNRDLGLLQQYLSGFDVTINAAASDLTADGRINNRDLGQLQRLLSGYND